MRLTIREGDGPTLGEALARAGADARALEEGRVFVGRRRARDASERVGAGDVVEIADPRPPAPDVPVLFHEDDLLAVAKPAGMPTIPDHAGSAHALVAAAARAAGVDASRLHPTSRLDRDVSGVVVFALGRAAAERMTAARAEGRYVRRYLAIAATAPSPDAGAWTAPIGRARDPRRRAVNGRDATAAETRYRVAARAPSLGASLLGIAPKTGRTHQIRVHASHAGAPLLGDCDYGGAARLTLPTGRVLELRRVALHAARVEVPQATGAPLVARAPVPPELEALWSALGGDPAAWELAATCAID